MTRFSCQIRFSREAAPGRFPGRMGHRIIAIDFAGVQIAAALFAQRTHRPIILIAQHHADALVLHHALDQTGIGAVQFTELDLARIEIEIDLGGLPLP